MHKVHQQQYVLYVGTRSGHLNPRHSVPECLADVQSITHLLILTGTGTWVLAAMISPLYWLLHPIHLLLPSRSVVNKGMIGGSLRTAPPVCTGYSTHSAVCIVFVPASLKPTLSLLPTRLLSTESEWGRGKRHFETMFAGVQEIRLLSREAANVSHLHFLSHFRQLIVLRHLLLSFLDILWPYQ